jgi:hypothetical protein
MGGMRFKNKPREEQAEADGMTGWYQFNLHFDDCLDVTNVCKLLTVDTEMFMGALLQ